MAGRENTILVQAINQRLFMPHDPHDGTPIGKRKHAPISIVKETDKSSPKLYQALVTGEKFSKVLLKYYRISPQGNEEHCLTQSFDDAVIISIAAKTPKTFLKKNEPFGDLELVSFCYNKVILRYEPDGIEFEDKDCTSSTFTDDFTNFMASVGDVVSKNLSNYGHRFSSHMEKSGKDVIKAMSNDYYQSLFQQFAWGATFSLTSLVIENSELNGIGGVINNVPVTKASIATTAASLLIDK